MPRFRVVFGFFRRVGLEVRPYPRLGDSDDRGLSEGRLSLPQEGPGAPERVGALPWAHSAEPGGKSAEVLEKLSGDRQVPFLVDAERGVMMGESDAIIEYLDANYAANGG